MSTADVKQSVENVKDPYMCDDELTISRMLRCCLPLIGTAVKVQGYTVLLFPVTMVSPSQV